MEEGFPRTQKNVNIVWVMDLKFEDIERECEQFNLNFVICKFVAEELNKSMQNFVNIIHKY